MGMSMGRSRFVADKEVRVVVACVYRKPPIFRPVVPLGEGLDFAERVFKLINGYSLLSEDGRLT